MMLRYKPDDYNHSMSARRYSENPLWRVTPLPDGVARLSRLSEAGP